MTTLILTNNLL